MSVGAESPQQLMGLAAGIYTWDELRLILCRIVPLLTDRQSFDLRPDQDHSGLTKWSQIALQLAIVLTILFSSGSDHPRDSKSTFKKRQVEI